MGERSAAVNAKWHLELLGRLALWVRGQLAAPGIGDLMVRAGAQGYQVGGQRVVNSRAGYIALPGHRAIANDGPLFGRLKMQRIGGLHIRLVKAGEDALGIGGFKLGIKVDLVIGGVYKAVQTLTGAGVRDRGGDF